MIRRRWARIGLAGMVLTVAACTGGRDEPAAPATTASSAAGPGNGPPSTAGSGAGSPSLVPSGRPPAPTRGVVRVAVWGAPDPGAPTIAGAGVRALVLPQLFVARPDGTWTAALVEPGSDRTAPDRRSATFRLRPGAAWSDGRPITAEDLRRNPDLRFVAGVDGPAPDGTITVRFLGPLPGWRRLWSGADAIAAPAPDVWGGPFRVAGWTRGLELVLAANRSWYGGWGPFLDEVRLVLVPDSVTARQLLAAGSVDVVMPPAATARVAQLQQVPGVDVGQVSRTGWWVGLTAKADGLALARRRALFGIVDRRPFVDTLLRDEASVLDGLAGPEDAVWAGAGLGDAAALKGAAVDVVGQLEEPMTTLLQRAMQRRARAAGGRLDLRNAEADRVEAWLAAGTFQAAITMQLDGPEVCWLCRFGGVDEVLARAADGGDATAVAALEAKLRDEALLLPLWRPKVVVAWRRGLTGVVANGYAANAAWNAWSWSQP